jgi:hypothetical protein
MYALTLAALHARHWIGIAVVAIALVWLLAAVAARLSAGRPQAPKKGNAAPRQPRADGLIEIYAGNLSYDMTDDQLRALFAKYGVVDSARIITHRPSGKSKGYGFVEMPHRPEAELAVDKINNTEVMGRRIRCNEAREDSRPDR